MDFCSYPPVHLIENHIESWGIWGENVKQETTTVIKES